MICYRNELIDWTEEDIARLGVSLGHFHQFPQDNSGILIKYIYYILFFLNLLKIFLAVFSKAPLDSTCSFSLSLYILLAHVDTTFFVIRHICIVIPAKNNINWSSRTQMMTNSWIYSGKVWSDYKCLLETHWRQILTWMLMWCSMWIDLLYTCDRISHDRC